MYHMYTCTYVCLIALCKKKNTGFLPIFTTKKTKTKTKKKHLNFKKVALHRL